MPGTLRPRKECFKEFKWRRINTGMRKLKTCKWQNTLKKQAESKERIAEESYFVQESIFSPLWSKTNICEFSNHNFTVF
jgi:hypothetical protein